MAELKAAELDLVASFYSERIEKVTTEKGSTVFIQRPKARADGFVASADEMPDNFEVSNVSVTNAQVYRISVGHIGFVVSYDASSKTVELSVKVHVPIIGGISIGKAKGNLKYGVLVKLNYKKIVTGEAKIELHDNSVVLHYDIEAFGDKLKDKLPIFKL